MKTIEVMKSLFQKRIFRHGLFWVGNLIFFMVLFYLTEGVAGMFNNFLKLFSVFALLALLFWIHQTVLVPGFYRERKYILYATYLLATLLLFTAFKYVIKFYLFHEVPDETFILENVGSFVVALFYIIVGSSISGFLRYNREKIHYQEMKVKLNDSEKQILEAELVALKAQINPHFLFNTLNNIYSLSLDKSDKAPKMILKLSDLMSYTLYDCREKWVDISKEIEFIRNYIELEKVRLDNGSMIDLQVTGTVADRKIAPLMFIPFIENAFKHGINNLPPNPYVQIGFDFTMNGKLYFKVENRKRAGEENGEKMAEGIGITNTKKRLNLLYPDKHRLQISEHQDIFNVELEIDLA